MQISFLKKYFVGACICSGLLVLRVLYKTFRGYINKSPPQLYGLPIIGSLLTTRIWKQTFLTKILPKYGDLVVYKNAGMTMYKINNANLCRKIFTKIYEKPDIVSSVFTSIDIEPIFASANDDKNANIRRRIFMQSLAFILNKLR